jgi:hypothetical protein
MHRRREQSDEFFHLRRFDRTAVGACRMMRKRLTGSVARGKSGGGARDKEAFGCGRLQDSVGSFQVPLHQDGRYKERVRVVVEAFAPAAVRRESVRWIARDAEQIADRIVVLRAVQTVNQNAPRILR